MQVAGSYIWQWELKFFLITSILSVKWKLFSLAESNDKEMALEE